MLVPSPDWIFIYANFQHVYTGEQHLQKEMRNDAEVSLSAEEGEGTCQQVYPAAGVVSFQCIYQHHTILDRVNTDKATRVVSVI